LGSKPNELAVKGTRDETRYGSYQGTAFEAGERAQRNG
jgi:hypothetical protein